MSNSNYQWMRKAGPVWSIPFLIPIATAIGGFMGWWLDSKFGTKPWLVIIFTLLGLASGLYESAKILIQATREDDD